MKNHLHSSDPVNVNRLILIAAPLLFLGCASYVKFSEARSGLPAVRAGLGRLYFYRDSNDQSFSHLPDGGLDPEVHLDRKLIGSAKMRTVFYTDVPAGPHKLELDLEASGETDVVVAAGETKFIRLNEHRFLRVGRLEPEVVPREQAESEIEGLAYFDPSPVRIPASSSLQK